jgi:hypothetical protein
MKQKTKLTPGEQSQLSETQLKPGAAREFTSAEELLRHDAAQTIVPVAVAKRLDESIQLEPKPERSWWRRLTGS